MTSSDRHGGDGFPLTFREGPCDPITMARGPGTWVEIHIDAPVEDVWNAVTDVDLPARFSEEFLGATWTGDGPGLGATFVGRNRHPAVGEWETESFVDEFEPHSVFGWAVSDPADPGARWRFRLRPSGQGTTLRLEVSLGPGPSGITKAIEAMPDKEARMITRRLGEHHANMSRTVDGIRRIVESR